jgi:hypothetical protein
MSTLFRLYYTEYAYKVIGLIGIGAYPVRFPPALKYLQQTNQIVSKKLFL